MQTRTQEAAEHTRFAVERLPNGMTRTWKILNAIPGPDDIRWYIHAIPVDGSLDEERLLSVGELFDEGAVFKLLEDSFDGTTLADAA